MELPIPLHLSTGHYQLEDIMMAVTCMDIFQYRPWAAITIVQMVGI
jgi:hypothetical protein